MCYTKIIILLLILFRRTITGCVPCVVVVLFLCLSAANAAPNYESEDMSITFAAPNYESKVMSETFAEQQIQNNFDERLIKHCHGGSGMYKVQSIHDNHREDRVWNWECHHILKHGWPICRQTGYVNNFDEPMFFKCNRNEYISGVESYHDNHYEDRRWKFICCGASGHITKSCRHTGYVNNFDEKINFQAGYKEVITGVYSYHDNHRE